MSANKRVLRGVSQLVHFDPSHWTGSCFEPKVIALWNLDPHEATVDLEDDTVAFSVDSGDTTQTLRLASVGFVWECHKCEQPTSPK